MRRAARVRSLSAPPRRPAPPRARRKSTLSETVAFSSSSFADKLVGSAAGDFWQSELAWQREELAKAFSVQVRGGACARKMCGAAH